MTSHVEVQIEHESDIVEARRTARELSAPLGFTPGQLAVIATAISEIARNIESYAGKGTVTVTVVEEAGRRGVRIVASDRGPGIVDIESAMSDGFTTGTGLGLGLPGARRLMDDFELQSEAGKGTTVTMVKWAS